MRPSPVLWGRRLAAVLTAWRVEVLVDDFQVIVIKIAHIGCVVARSEVAAYSWLAFARATRFYRGGVHGIDLSLIVSDKPHIQSGLTELALS